MLRKGRKPHPQREQPSLRVKDLDQENTHLVIRVTPLDRSDQDFGELFRTLDQLEDKQLKPSESLDDIMEGTCAERQQTQLVPKKYQAAILH